MLRKLPLLLLLLLGVMALTLVACGDDDDDDDDDATPTATADSGDDDGGAAVVAVDLKEFEVNPDVSSVAAGDVEFVATNSGTLVHELVIIRSDLAPDALPVDGGLVPESEVDVVDEIEEFAAGTTERATLTLEAGNYILICNIAGHYEGGMRTAFTVE